MFSVCSGAARTLQLGAFRTAIIALAELFSGLVGQTIAFCLVHSLENTIPEPPKSMEMARNYHEIVAKA